VSAEALLARLRGGLIVSVQAEAGSPLNDPAAIALLARVAERNGAAGLRIEGAGRIAAVRAAVRLPIVGIVKRRHEGFAPYITSTRGEIDEAVRAGADVVAFDATLRPRVEGDDLAALIAHLRARGAIAMADCAEVAEAEAAAAAGAELLATTLAGYTEATAGRALPALDLVRAIAARHPFAICEGGVGTPDELSAAFAAGASAVVVGTAITNVDVLVRRFVAATPLGSAT